MTKRPSTFVGRAADRLAVDDLRAAHVRLDAVLALHAVDEDLEVQLAHAGDHRLAGLLVGLDLEGRVLLGQAAEGDVDIFSLSTFVFGSIATLMTGSGKSMRSRQDGALGRAQRVAGA